MAHRVFRWAASAVFFAAAFVVNPAFIAGCISGDDDEPTSEELAKIEAELKADLDTVNGVGAWKLEKDGVQYELLVELRQQMKSEEPEARRPRTNTLMPVAHACGTHSFYASASACFTVYQLVLEGSFTLRRLGDDPQTIVADIPVKGQLWEGGVDLSFEGQGHLELSVRDEQTALESFEARDLGAERLTFPARD